MRVSRGDGGHDVRNLERQIQGLHPVAGRLTLNHTRFGRQWMDFLGRGRGRGRRRARGARQLVEKMVAANEEGSGSEAKKRNIEKKRKEPADEAGEEEEIEAASDVSEEGEMRMKRRKRNDDVDDEEEDAANEKSSGGAAKEGMEREKKKSKITVIDSKECRISAPDFLHGLPRDFQPDDSFKSYVKVAAYLLCCGWYLPLLNVIVDCFLSISTFVVLDCASGAGKTQLAVALIMLASRNVSLLGKRLLVAHVVWPSACPSQRIYVQANAYQKATGIWTTKFFLNMKIWLEFVAQNEGNAKYTSSLWNHVLSKMFTNESEDTFKRKFCVIVLDEIPLAADELVLVGKIRDALKVVDNIVLLLSGTNSKAANMIGLSSGDATSTEHHTEHGKWSFLITRVPRYFVEASQQANGWQALQKFDRSQLTPAACLDFDNAIKAIEISIKNHGNPRLIEFAIRSLIKVTKNPKNFSFGEWQLDLTYENVQSKFCFSKLSHGKEILLSQVNLLLCASAVHGIADAMIHRHYAHRAYPDDGKHFGLAELDNPCGGWLYIAPDRWRCLGHALYARAMDETIPESCFTAARWQVTVFQPLERDPVLYLASCWRSGYFSLFCTKPQVKPDEFKFTALTMVNSVWKPNTFGGLNFQNPVVCINTGARLEVAVTLAIMNAGAMHSEPSMNFSLFLRNFLFQLEIKTEMVDSMCTDPAFQGLLVPRWIFPVIREQSAAMPVIPNNIGIVIREPNISKHDATLCNIKGKNKLGVNVDNIRFEMKDRKAALSPQKIREVAAKLFSSDGVIGFCCVCKSQQYWTNKDVRATLWKELKSLKIGRVYLITSDQRMICCKLNGSLSGRFIIVQVDKTEF
mmetsp:Transcript_45149/g.94559  ORF Transcript_45149/g.94559 Transcript_45149/m.94559 type:complete len:859 (-) Transcript_45149:639-3215(-)